MIQQPNHTTQPTQQNFIEKNKFSFCSILKDHLNVLNQSRVYPYINVKYDINDITRIPETFDGRMAWSMYILPSVKQRSSSSWALVARDILNDRFCLSTSGQLYFFLDYIEILTCMETPPLEKIQNIPSMNSYDGNPESDATKGYSIYDAWEYIYAHGLSNWNCISRKHIVDYGLKTPELVSYKDKKNYYNEYCVKSANQCLGSVNSKKARKLFYSGSIFNIEGSSMSERIMNIKYQIVKWGPVAGGFIIYENFIKDYKGLDIYSKAEGKPIGGHYVSIIGWGKEKGVEYWICRNSFGSDWGLLGYFYMKMGIEECQLEYNISAVSPSIPNNPKYERRLLGMDGMLYDGRKIYIDRMDMINPDLYRLRESQQYNNILFYKQETINLIKEGKLDGKLEPLIQYPDLLPDMSNFWAMDLTKYDYVNVSGKTFYEDKIKEKSKENNDAIYLYALILGAIFFFIGLKRRS